jgi:curved DNA-binding protein CbpA
VQPCQAEGQVMVMAAADHAGPPGDLYQLLGVPREASREEIALAWRRRARDEHPDARPSDAAPPDRFRALAEAYRVLGDPDRRAAYDRALARERPPAARITVRPAGPGRVTPLAGMAGPPLVAGPVRVEGPCPAPPAGGRDEQDVRLAVLAGLALRYLAAGRGRPW